MTNIDLIKEDYKVGDAIRITCELGVKEGTIIDFLEGRIKLHPISGGKPFYIKEENIGDWEEGFLGVANESLPLNAETSDKINSPTSQNDTVITVDDKNPTESQSESNKINEEKSKPELKILGVIPPEEWEKRGMNKKNKKNGSESQAKEKMKSIGSDLSSLGALLSPDQTDKVVNNVNKEHLDHSISLVSQASDGQKPKYYSKNQKFKAALGSQPKSDLAFTCSTLIKSYEQDEENLKNVYAVGFISVDRTQYGFIWDQELQNEIFFSANDICEAFLFDMENLVGTQVVYRKVFNPSPKNKGKEMAVGICLPHRVADLLALSDSLSDDPHTIQHARDILETVLSQYPNNEDALRVVEEISNKTHCLKSSSVTKKIDEGLLRTFADSKNISYKTNAADRQSNNVIQPNKSEVTSSSGLPEPAKPEALSDTAILSAILKKRTSMSEEKCRELEKELDSLIRSGNREECLIRSYQILNTACPTPKYYRSYLDRIVNTEIALGHTEEALSSISQLIVYNEMQSDTKKNTLCHLYLSMGRLLYNLGQDDEAKKAIDYAAWLVPDNIAVQNLRNQLSINQEDTNIENNDDVSYVGKIGKMLLQDIQQKLIEVSAEDANNPQKVYIRARSAQKDNTKSFETRAQLFLNAAASYLKANQESTLGYGASAAHYARLKGYSMCTRISEALLRYPDTREEVCAYCDSAKSYFLESLGTYGVNQKTFLKELLWSYLKLERVMTQIQGGKTPEADWDSCSPIVIMNACLNEENIEEQKALYRTCIAIGATAEDVWNTIANDQDGTGRLYGKLSEPEFRESAFKTLNELEHSDINLSLNPGAFLHAIFDHRQELSAQFNLLLSKLLSWDFDQFLINEFNNDWKEMTKYQMLLLPTDIKLAELTSKVIATLSSYADRPELDRSRKLNAAQQLMLNGLEAIKNTTTFYGRTFFFHLFSNWLLAIQKQIKIRQSIAYPKLVVDKDTPFIKSMNGEKYISYVVSNIGESTADSYRIVIQVNDYKEEKVFSNYLIANQKDVNTWIIPQSLSDIDSIEVNFEVYTTYEGSELAPVSYSGTFQIEHERKFEQGDPKVIPWRISKVPPEQIFKGRERDIEVLVNHYCSPDRDWTYIMYGLTRTGKTSLLDYLRKRIAQKPLFEDPSWSILPFEWDFTNVAGYKEGDENEFWENLASTNIYEKLPEDLQDIVDKSYKTGEFPQQNIGQNDFEKLIDILNINKIMPFITIDEFSNVKIAMNGGLLNAAFLSLLRNLSHRGKACFIYAGTYDIKDLPTDKRYGLTGQLVSTKKMEVNAIDEDSANELIGASPIIVFTDEAKARIRRLSGCVPYWIQWICLNCGNYAAYHGMWCLGKREVEEVIAVMTGENSAPNPKIHWAKIEQANFQNNQYSPDAPEEEALLTCIAYLNRDKIDTPRGVGIQELNSLWAKEKTSNELQNLMRRAIPSLVLRKVLYQYQDEDREVYSFSVDLFRRWWYRHHRDLKVYLEQ